MQLTEVDAVAKALEAGVSDRLYLGAPVIVEAPASTGLMPAVLQDGFQRRRVDGPFVHIQRNATVGRRFVPRKDGAWLQLPDFLPPYYQDVVRRIDAHEAAHPTEPVRTIHAEPTYVAFTAKYREYGHFLLEVLPKLLLARALIEAGNNYPVLVPLNPPDWVSAIISRIFAGKRLQPFDENSENAVLPTAIFPSSLNSGWFHPLFSDLIDDYLLNGLLPDVLDEGPERIFISRVRFRAQARRDFRVWENELQCRDLAEKYGFFALEPETLPIERQMALFRSARSIIGESSSALHSAIFNQKRASLLVINCVNHVQTAIAAMRGQTMQYVLPSDGSARDWSNLNRVPPAFSIEPGIIAGWVAQQGALSV